MKMQANFFLRTHAPLFLYDFFATAHMPPLIIPARMHASASYKVIPDAVKLPARIADKRYVSSAKTPPVTTPFAIKYLPALVPISIPRSIASTRINMFTPVMTPSDKSANFAMIARIITPITDISTDMSILLKRSKMSLLFILVIACPPC